MDSLTHDINHHNHMLQQADNSSDIMMKSYFHGGFGDTYLFRCLVLDTRLKMWSIATLLFLVSMAFEYVKYIRCVRCGCPSGRYKCSTISDNVAIRGDNSSESCYVGRFHTRKHRLIQTLLHTLQTTLGFVLMLSLMTFNVCLIFPIIVGSAVGYHMFYRPYNEVESIESCH